MARERTEAREVEGRSLGGDWIIPETLESLGFMLVKAGQTANIRGRYYTDPTADSFVSKKDGSILRVETRHTATVDREGKIQDGVRGVLVEVQKK